LLQGLSLPTGCEGAVVMTSGDGGGLVGDEIMHSIAAEYGWPDYHPTVRSAVEVDLKILAQYVGTFELQPGFNLVVTVENGKLVTQATGQGKILLYAESDSKFFPTRFPAEIEFFKDDQGKVSCLILHQNGHDMKALKK
jgi:Domain of unknown function (DUF3471)